MRQVGDAPDDAPLIGSLPSIPQNITPIAGLATACDRGPNYPRGRLVGKDPLLLSPLATFPLGTLGTNAPIGRKPAWMLAWRVPSPTGDKRPSGAGTGDKSTAAPGQLELTKFELTKWRRRVLPLDRGPNHPQRRMPGGPAPPAKPHLTLGGRAWGDEH